MLALWWPTNADTYPLTLIKQRKIYAMNTKSRINWKLFRLLFGAGVFGSLAALPYTLTILGDQISESSKSLPLIMAIITAQNVAGLAFALYFGLLLGKKVGLGAPILEDWLAKRPTKERLKSVSLFSVKWGVFAGALILVGDDVFALFMEEITF